MLFPLFLHLHFYHHMFKGNILSTVKCNVQILKWTFSIRASPQRMRSVHVWKD